MFEVKFLHHFDSSEHFLFFMDEFGLTLKEAMAWRQKKTDVTSFEILKSKANGDLKAPYLLDDYIWCH